MHTQCLCIYKWSMYRSARVRIVCTTLVSRQTTTFIVSSCTPPWSWLQFCAVIRFSCENRFRCMCSSVLRRWEMHAYLLFWNYTISESVPMTLTGSSLGLCQCFEMHLPGTFNCRCNFFSFFLLIYLNWNFVKRIISFFQFMWRRLFRGENL